MKETSPLLVSYMIMKENPVFQSVKSCQVIIVNFFYHEPVQGDRFVTW